MNKFISTTSKALIVLLSGFFVAACNDDDGPTPTPEPESGQYSLVLCVGSWPNTAYYIADLPSLTEGQVSLAGNGAEMTGKVYAQDVIQRNGFYYHANSGSGRFGKYHVENGALVTDKEIPFSWLDWSSYAWINDQTLVIFGTGDNEGRYAKVNVADMSVTTGTLDLEGFPDGFDTYSIGFAEYRDNKLFVGYGFMSSDWSLYPDMPVYQSLYIAVIDYNTMQTEKTLSDTRSTTPGGPTVYAPASFIDENNDIYFITDPVYNYDYNSPSMVYRIKSGSTDLDAAYAFNFSAATQNGMGPAMWHIGNGKAIVRTRVAGQSIDAEHSFSVIDVRNGSFIKKLDLPADKGERMVQAVIVENGKAYIAVNADRDFIWEYDPATDQLKQGAEIVGGVDFVLRLEKLN
ncbi:DUF4374 domain-containing protein [Parapedobacter koreensis]|uniref:DUF4374 domain-containing protein n=1 Tax=Parapedobacter koreensis TaxID=332977 RepID=A0A1H7S2D6_9SPHI|nr:DUF4374 domain-containing protein [Parapedobacter koreensis]SEL66770.1 protein of unknown function [Parapedobacter koreensis]